MAALDRRIPSLDDFVGQSWNSWTDRASAFVSEACDVEECSKNGKKKAETMTLRKEDMSIFGHCPAHDSFYLVVCSHCGQVVKPQAFERHCERRHGPLGKLYSRLHCPPYTTPPRPRPSGTPASHGTPRIARDNRPPHTLPQPPLSLSQHGPAKEGSSFVPVGGVTQAPHPSDAPPFPASPGSREPPWQHRGGPSPSEKPLQRRGEGGGPPDLPIALRGPRTYSKTYKKVPKKECDLDKHCGVMDLEKKKLCTRLLTCNIHSIHQRRQVLGRSKNFDQLVAELKMSTKVRERAVPVREVPDRGSPSPEPPAGHMGTPLCKRRLPNCTADRSRTPSGSGAEEGGRGEEQDLQPPHPPSNSRLSSDESDGEGQEDPMVLPCTSWHPKPLALCSFGSHALGRGVFTFDRRLHHLRSALHAMVEQHLSAHLWKKIPQAADLQSQRSVAPPPATTASSHFNSQHSTGSTPGRAGPQSGSSLRTGTSSSSYGSGREVRPLSCSPSPGTACGLSESRGGSQPITSPLLANTPSSVGRPRNPVGRPSKQQQQPSPAGRKRKKSPPGDTSPIRDRNWPALERSRLPVTSKTTPCPSTSPHGPMNGTLSPGSKPCPQPPSPEPHFPSLGLTKRPPPPVLSQPPPPDPSSRGRGGGPGLHRKAVSYDHKGLGKKRKSSGAPAMGPSRPSKLHRLSASSHSGFFSWKKDGKAAALSAEMDRKLSTQKPKLHH
ncbi:hypothetical protein MATL_G00109580 [Megalops atlanticus]|uniref:SCA7 domain-containing protein n=1 Tax=Megalops atlanticus TaxID=7932 RepID=A0A9D3Q2U9_MEGAT|nr:hypothetical protein MATL_G00109580 [Megalops atlanticus]